MKKNIAAYQPTAQYIEFPLKCNIRTKNSIYTLINSIRFQEMRKKNI